MLSSSSRWWGGQRSEVAAAFQSMEQTFRMSLTRSICRGGQRLFPVCTQTDADAVKAGRSLPEEQVIRRSQQLLCSAAPSQQISENTERRKGDKRPRDSAPLASLFFLLEGRKLKQERNKLFTRWWKNHPKRVWMWNSWSAQLKNWRTSSFLRSGLFLVKYRNCCHWTDVNSHSSNTKSCVRQFNI